MATSTSSNNSRCCSQHHHVPKIFALPDSTPQNDQSQQYSQQQNKCGSSLLNTILQLVNPGEGQDRMATSNLIFTQEQTGTPTCTEDGGHPHHQNLLSLHRPILIRDTPESIGMKIPKGKGNRNNGNTGGDYETTTTTTKSKSKSKTAVPFSVRDVADVVGHNSPVEMIDVVDQTDAAADCDWNFGDLVEYFEDKTRVKQQQQLMTAVLTNGDKNSCSTAIISPITRRVRRRAAIRSEQILDEALRPPQPKIFNQISYEFSGTPLHDMVQSPKFVRDVDWIDIAWPHEKKPQHINNTNKKKGGCKYKGGKDTKKKGKRKVNSNNNRSKSNNGNKHEGKDRKAKEYPVVQYYCLTSAAGSYTDFHIDFGGSSVWYHVVQGQKVFVVCPPTRENLRVYEEWLCRSDQEHIFLPELMRKQSSPDVHSYSSCYNSISSFSSGMSTSAISCSSSSMTRTMDDTNINAEDLQDEMNFFKSSLTKTLSTSNALRFTLNVGETLFIPAGWIHAVYTPVDSLVFGGNFMHGLDMQLQFSVNALETRTRVLDKYRFPYFEALQMYAGGMYLRRLRSMHKGKISNDDDQGEMEKIEEVDERKHQGDSSTERQCHEGHQKKEKDWKENIVESAINSIATSHIGTTTKESDEPQQISDLLKQTETTYSAPNQNSTRTNEENFETSISKRELEELPMLMNALEYWWMSAQESKEENRDGLGTDGVSRTLDFIASQSSFVDAAFYVAEENACDSVENFISSLRNEYARVSKEQWGDCSVSPSPFISDKNIVSSLPILSNIPISIGKPKKKPSHGAERHKRRQKKANLETNLNDPLDVALSTSIKEYLASIQITTAAQLLLARTIDVAKNFPDWRKKKGMSKLENNGEIASVSVWKRKVRLKAALVGAKKLARLNEGTNMKSVVDEEIQIEIVDSSPSPIVTDKDLFKRVAKELSILSSPPTKRLNMNSGGNTKEIVTTPTMFYGNVERSILDGQIEIGDIGVTQQQQQQQKHKNSSNNNTASTVNESQGQG